MNILIRDIVSDTYTNNSGFVLNLAIKNALVDNDIVILNFDGASITSSSFLNSSIGDIVNSFGFDILKRIKPVKLSGTQADVLKKYILSLKKSEKLSI